MERASTASIKLAQAVLVAVFAVVAYHAVTAPVNPEEARAFNRAIGVPLRGMFQHYDPTNDVLYTWLAKLVLTVFRLAEWSLRLPALAGAALYFWGVFRLSRKLFGTGMLFLAAVSVLALPPPVVACLGEARGYGLALGFWLWALVFLLESDKPEKLNLAGVALGLSAASHLSFAFPVAALCLWRRNSALALYATVTAFILLALPMSHADAVALSANGGVLLRGWSLVAIPLLIAAAWSREQIGNWMAGSAVVTILLLWITHRMFGAPYPTGASAIYWVPILTLAALAVIKRLGYHTLRDAALLVAAYYAWIVPIHGESAAPRELAKALRKDAAARPVRIAASSDVMPVLDFYRTRYGQWNWTVLDGKEASGPFDYYVFGPADAAVAGGSGLRIVYSDGGMVLARFGSVL